MIKITKQLIKEILKGEYTTDQDIIILDKSLKLDKIRADEKLWFRIVKYLNKYYNDRKGCDL